jgi:hypothetical protein
VEPVGASSWEYLAPYQPDLDAALKALRQRVFEEHDYVWDGEGDYPATMDELFDDPSVRYSGTHSILDVSHVLAPEVRPHEGAVEPVSVAEAVAATGTDRPTRAHIEGLTNLTRGPWFGRCAVLHDDRDEPTELYFFGYSGD